MPRKVRDYKSEYAKYHSKPEQKKNRAARNGARKLMERKLGSSAIAGRDIDHKRPLSKGGSNSTSNLRVQSPSRNRSYKRTKSGAIKG